MIKTIHNGIIVNQNQQFHGFIQFQNGIITNIQQGKYNGELKNAIDAQGAYIIPGAIDDQVHFREPGLTQKATIESESRAAAAGGVTSFMDMPNTMPQTTTIQNWEWKMNQAQQTAAVNYAFFMGATNENLEVISRINKTQIPGVKVFMGSSTGGMLVDTTKKLEAIFAQCPTLVATHCEDEQMIQAAMQKYGTEATITDHPLIRSAEACYRSSARAVEIATKYNTRLHILHLSTERELSLFDTKPLEQKLITNEVCAHHLWFTDRDYKQLGNAIKCNPAIKTKQDRDALRLALTNGRVDIIATDHAPHTLDEKLKPYTQAPSGMPMIQHSVQMMLEIFEPQKVVEYMAHRPAICFGVEKRGFLKTGYYADIVLVEKNSQTVQKNQILYKCGWTPVEGTKFGHTIKQTFVNGNLVYSDGVVDHTAPRGQALRFQK